MNENPFGKNGKNEVSGEDGENVICGEEIIQVENASRNLVSSFNFALTDSTPVILRPVISEDRERIKNGLSWMSLESRYSRFFSSTPRLTDEQLRYLTEVDQVNHVAWGALDSLDLNIPGLGVGRFVRLKNQPTIAEMAITVIDAYQGRGLGAILMAVLYLMAQACDIHTLRGIILPHNRSLSNKLTKLGATVTYHQGAFHVDLPVHQDLSLIPKTSFGDRFKFLLKDLQGAMYRRDHEDPMTELT